MQLLFLSEVRVDVEERVSDMSCVRTRALAQLIGTHVFNGIGFRLGTAKVQASWRYFSPRSISFNTKYRKDIR